MSGFLSRDVIKLCRPYQWVKNVFVLAPLLFSESMLRWPIAGKAFLAAACFCFWSSAVYCLNDVLDRTADQRHPRKNNRPVAAGRISPRLAIAISLAMSLIGFTLAWLISNLFLVFGGLYLLNSAFYFVLLKRKVIADVLAIAIGFVIRLLAGCAAIAVLPSSWLLVCGFSFALLLGFGKRRLEVDLPEDPTAFRSSLRYYSAEKLNLLLGVTASVCLVSYMLYTQAPETIRKHGTANLVFTVPLVAYGLFRYLFKVQEGRFSGPEEVLLTDWVFLATGVAWIISVLAVLYVFKASVVQLQ